LINRERRQKHGLVGKPGLPELLDEINAHATWQEHIDRPWAGGGDLRQLGRIIKLAEWNVDLVGNLTLVEALKAGECVAARLVVRCNKEHFLQPRVRGVLTRHAERLIVLIGSDKKVRIAFLASEIGGAGVWADQDNAGVGHRLEDCLQNIRKDRSDDEVDLVALNQSLCRSEEHTSELQSLTNLVCRLLLEKKNTMNIILDAELIAIVCSSEPYR